ncbi:cysteine hydrolase [Lysobacter sp. H21R4]|uniref:cysteine hydrolase family protein n=1 Tax=Lysobacter sp. H21R4 TaxID=2781021 RepID=UPI0018891310|nr:cysteine hydrolase [Lysobacter sp. H21R4]QOY61687.1 cysteine hydrolase [Lysobacter sp. H21R4]
MKVSAHTALLVIDMINPFDFEDGAAHAKAALSIAPAIGRVKARVRDAGGQCIYVNDNFGRWKSNFLQIIERADKGLAPKILDHLMPDEEDLFVLKPRHSAFFQTPLPLLLESLESTGVVITGIAADACVLVTALDAHMRGFDVHAPTDCVAALSQPRKQAALQVMRNADVLTTAAG